LKKLLLGLRLYANLNILILNHDARNLRLGETGNQALIDWHANTPWWISNFLPNIESEIGMVSSSLAWSRLPASLTRWHPHQRQRAATSSGNRQIQLLRPTRRTRRAPTLRAARHIDDRSASLSGRRSISTTGGQHHVPSSTLSAVCAMRKHRAAWR
jgi:hypothetical protein